VAKQDGYILEQEEYPEKGKRVANLIYELQQEV